MIKNILAVLNKEIQSEFRTRYAISAVLLFVLTTITMIVFSLANEKMTPEWASGLLWIIMFFASMTGLAKTFVSEEERGTGFLLLISTDSSSIFFGKLLFNVFLSLFLNIVSIFLFFIFIGNITIYKPFSFWVVMFFGSVGMASSTTIISSLIAKANTKNALFPILSFPVLLPLIMLGIQLTQQTFEKGAITGFQNDINLIISYCGLMIVVSYFLFDFIWRD